MHNSNLDNLATKAINIQATFSNGYCNLTHSIAIDGFDAVALAGFSAGSTYIFPSKLWLNTGTQEINLCMRVYNGDTYNDTVTINIYLICIPVI